MGEMLLGAVEGEYRGGFKIRLRFARPLCWLSMLEHLMRLLFI
jgi:hypothetical protein